jgi:hypothetical protein
MENNNINEINQNNINIDKTTYMREYKRRQYKEKGDDIKEKNKAYYYKYKYNLSSEEMHKYDTLLPSVIRLKKELEYLKLKKPDIIFEILQPYL